MGTTTIYSVSGMTCMGCVAHVKKTIEAMEGVAHVMVDLPLNRAFIQANAPIESQAIQKLLGEKYRVETLGQDKIAVPISVGDSLSTSDHLNAVDSPWKQLKPLYLIFGFLIGGVFLAYFSDIRELGIAPLWSEMMLDFMALFYLVFAFFKLLDLKGFPASFAMYDPIAKRVSFYGKLYPFIELGLGVLLLMRIGVFQVLVITLIILGATTIGVVQSLLSKRKIQCACLGTALKLPMTQATFIENAIMIAMALAMLV
jgi:copper chaperone CopZ